MTDRKSSQKRLVGENCSCGDHDCDLSLPRPKAARNRTTSFRFRAGTRRTKKYARR